MKPILLPLALLAAGLASGCATFGGNDDAAMQAQEDKALLDEKFTKLQGRIETVEMELQRIQQQLDAMPRPNNAQVQQLDASVQDLTRRVQQLDASREQDKKEIVDKLTGKISQIMAATSGSSSSAPARPVTKGNKKTGGEYEHVVEPGQTLSALATTYGVRQADIIQANGLKEPYMLRVGQKLIIPAP